MPKFLVSGYITKVEKFEVLVNASDTEEAKKIVAKAHSKDGYDLTVHGLGVSKSKLTLYRNVVEPLETVVEAALPNRGKPAKRPRPPVFHLVIAQHWLESERGWGQRPDGVSLHLSEKDRVAYCEEYWAAEKKYNTSNQAPECYSREDGSPSPINVDETTFKKIKNSKHGISISDAEFAKIKKLIPNVLEGK